MAHDNTMKGEPMNTITTKMMLGAAACLLAVNAHAQRVASLNAARVGGPDVQALAKFYQNAFGLQEVNRISLPGGQIEIMLNFGSSIEAAKANSAAQIVIMYRAEELKDPVPHLILNVDNLAVTSTAITGAGGKIGKPIAFGKLTLGIATDPAGNQIELIQQPKG